MRNANNSRLTLPLVGYSIDRSIFNRIGMASVLISSWLNVTHVIGEKLAAGINVLCCWAFVAANWTDIKNNLLAEEGVLLRAMEKGKVIEANLAKLAAADVDIANIIPAKFRDCNGAIATCPVLIFHLDSNLEFIYDYKTIRSTVRQILRTLWSRDRYLPPPFDEHYSLYPADRLQDELEQWILGQLHQLNLNILDDPAYLTP